jgi:hypothetical protein
MYKLKLNQIREVLGMEVKLEVAKLIDGVTVVEYERLEPGFPVFIVSEDGTTKTPAPAGEHKLEGGIEIEVDETGTIMEVSSEGETPEAEAPEVAEDVVEVAGEEVVTEDKVDVAMEEKVMEVIEEKIAEKMKMIFEVVEEVAKEVGAIKEEMGAMKTKMEKFSKAPAAGAAPKVTTATPEKFDSIEAKLEFIKSLKK